jgi:Ribbon-helix-helix protein, copG family
VSRSATFEFRVTPEELALLKKLARKRGLTPSAHLRKLIEEDDRKNRRKSS